MHSLLPKAKAKAKMDAMPTCTMNILLIDKNISNLGRTTGSADSPYEAAAQGHTW
jgi:hypothetical protein